MIFIRGFLKNLVICAMCGFFSFCDLVAMRAEIPTYDRDDATVKRVTAYVREYINPNMHYIADRKQLSNEQQAYLYNWIQRKEFHDISGQQTYRERRDTFNSGKVSDYGSRGKVVAGWCEKYGSIAWPTETIKRSGKSLHAQFHAHHIIPLEFGGLNKWWNIVSLPSRIHSVVHTEVDGQLFGGGYF